MNVLSRLSAFVRCLALLCLFFGAASPALATKTYSDNLDGTVTDPTTGLTWMRCSMGQTWDGTTCTGTASTYTWDQSNALPGTSADIAHYLLTNVNGVDPDATTLASATEALNAPPDISYNQGDFLWHLAESVANQSYVGLVRLAATGLAFG